MKWLISFVQISIILLAVLITALRLNSGNVPSLTPSVEAWFDEQGLIADIQQTQVHLSGVNIELLVNGLVLKDAKHQPVLTLQYATLNIDFFQSLIQRKLVLKNASLFLHSFSVNTQQYAALFEGSEQQTMNLQSLIQHPAVAKLMTFDDVSLTIKQIHITSEKQQKQVIYNTSFSINDEGPFKQLQLVSGLQQQKGDQLKVAINIDRDSLLQQHKLSGAAYLNLLWDDLSDLSQFDDRLKAGEVSLKSWMNFDDDQLLMQSTISVDQAELKAAQKAVAVSLDLNLLSELNSERLTLQSLNSQVSLNGQPLKEFNVVAEAQLLSDLDIKNPTVLLEKTNLESLSKVASAFITLKDQLKTVKQFNAQGEIDSLLVAIDKENIQNSPFELKTGPLQWQKVADIPSVKGLAVNVLGSMKRMDVEASAEHLELGLTQHLFKQVSLADNVKVLAQAYIQEDNQWAVNIPSFSLHRFETKAEGRVLLMQDAGSSPLMALRVQATNADVINAPPYYPEKIMDDDVVQWLKDSLVEGKVKTTDVLYFGRLENDVNFDVKNNGIFHIVLDVENAILKYDPAWPSATIDQAYVVFKNYQLKASSQQGALKEVPVSKAYFEIDNLLEGVAQLHLEAQGSLKKQWGVLNETPLSELIPYFKDVTNLSGSSKTKVDVTLPLANLGHEALPFAVDIRGQKAGFKLSKLGLDIKQLNSNIRITDRSLQIPITSLNWFSHPMKMEAKTDEQQIIHLKMSSQGLPIEKLWHYMPKSVPVFAKGQSDWDIDVDMNLFSHQQPQITINAMSNLLGTELTLPPPLAKSASSKQAMNLTIQLEGDSALDMRVYWKNRLLANSRFNIEQDQFKLSYASIGLGQEKPANAQSGIYIQGNLDRLNLNHWQEFLNQDDAEREPFNLASLIDLKLVKLSINEIAVGRYISKDNSIDVKQSKIGLSGVVSSSLIKGKVSIPTNTPIKSPISLNLDYLRLFPEESIQSDTSITNPNFMPSLSLSSKELNYNGMVFSDVNLEIRTQENNQFELKNLNATQGGIHFDVAGNWSKKGEAHDSHAFISAKGSNLGASLKALNFGDVIENGDIKFSGELFWDKPFFSMDVAETQGKAHLEIYDGFIKDVEPGGGRFVGLLSLSTVPRRLSLDFSDFFKQGLKFESITGDFELHDGSFWTNNLKLSGPSSKVDITGRTGVIDRDYDQKITIIPQIGDTLPVLGSLIAGGPTAWSLLLFQRMFKKEIDDSVTIKYDLTGSWDDPKLTLIPPPKTDIDTNNESDF